jgi:hypothetical protein
MSRLSLLRAGTAAIALCASLPAIAQTNNPLNLPTQGNIAPGVYPYGLVQTQFGPTTATTTVSVGLGQITNQATGNQIILNVPGGTSLNTPGFSLSDPATPVNPGPFATLQTSKAAVTATTTVQGSVGNATIRNIATSNLLQVTGEPGSTANIGRVDQNSRADTTATTTIMDVATTGDATSTFLTAAQGNIASFDGIKVNLPSDGQTIDQSASRFQTAIQTFGNVAILEPLDVTTTAIGNGVFATGSEANRADILVDTINQRTKQDQTAITTFTGGSDIAGGAIRTTAIGNTVSFQTSADDARAILDNLSQTVGRRGGQTATTTIEAATQTQAAPLNIVTSASGNVLSLTGDLVAGDSDIVQTVKAPQVSTTTLNLERTSTAGDLTVGTYAFGNTAALTGELVRGNSPSGNTYDFIQKTNAGQTASLNAAISNGTTPVIFDTRAIGNDLSLTTNRLQDFNAINQTTNAPQWATSTVVTGNLGSSLSVQTIATGNSIQLSIGRP